MKKILIIIAILFVTNSYGQTVYDKKQNIRLDALEAKVSILQNDINLIKELLQARASNERINQVLDSIKRVTIYFDSAKFVVSKNIADTIKVYLK